jgi:hypothetical protein
VVGREALLATSDLVAVVEPVELAGGDSDVVLEREVLNRIQDE